MSQWTKSIGWKPPVDYNAATAYAPPAVVRFGNPKGAYINILACTGVSPTQSGNNANWRLISEDGADGATGATGAASFSKIDSHSPAFFKVSDNTISVKAGLSCLVGSTPVSVSSDTAITLPTLISGTDYAIYACADGTIRADASFTVPAGYTVATTRQIGGFHYSVSNGINAYSIWDLKWRPTAPDPRGMVFVAGKWFDIYLTNTNPALYGTSKYNVAVASGTQLPARPAMFGGGAYTSLNWFESVEIAAAAQKRLMTYAEFITAAYGVTENQSLGGASVTVPLTKNEPGYRSAWGLEQATGNHWIWGLDSGVRWDAPNGWGWRDVTNGRGQMYMQGDYAQTKVLLGGSRYDGASSGSRASNWLDYPWASVWNIGLRCACDHLRLE